MTNENKPEHGKVYSLTGATNSIMNGNTWAESEVKQLPCHVCGVKIDVEELDENGAYTYPDNKPYCPSHYPNE